MRHAALLLLTLVAGCAAGPDWAFDPEAEEGVHGNVQVEWWYHFGWLTDEDGREWAFFSSFFRAKLGKLPRLRYLIHDLIDLETGARDYHSRVGGEALAAAAALGNDGTLPRGHGLIRGPMREKAGDPLDLSYGDARLARLAPGRYRLAAGGVDLELRAASEPMAVEGTGLTGLGRPEDMHYYTIPRLEARGTVRGRKATGTFWYDHQWGASWVGPRVGWSWWGLQLEDGSAVNAVVLRELGTGRIHKATCTHDRKVYPLTARPTRSWTSATGVRYPVAWALEAGPLRLDVEPAFDDRELPVIDEQKSIWEGPVRVTGSHAGRGFQELVGYAREQGEAR